MKNDKYERGKWPQRHEKLASRKAVPAAETVLIKRILNISVSCSPLVRGVSRQVTTSLMVEASLSGTIQVRGDLLHTGNPFQWHAAIQDKGSFLAKAHENLFSTLFNGMPPSRTKVASLRKPTNLFSTLFNGMPPSRTKVASLRKPTNLCNIFDGRSVPFGDHPGER